LRLLNRRRFLKYAGGTAALVGASALGVNYFSTQPAITTTSITDQKPKFIYQVSRADV
jgi:hypothetical protein